MKKVVALPFSFVRGRDGLFTVLNAFDSGFPVDPIKLTPIEPCDIENHRVVFALREPGKVDLFFKLSFLNWLSENPIHPLNRAVLKTFFEVQIQNGVLEQGREIPVPSPATRSKFPPPLLVTIDTFITNARQFFSQARNIAKLFLCACTLKLLVDHRESVTRYFFYNNPLLYETILNMLLKKMLLLLVSNI